MQEIYSRTPMPESDLNKVAKHNNVATYFQNTFSLKNTSWGLLLRIVTADAQRNSENNLWEFFEKVLQQIHGFSLLTILYSKQFIRNYESKYRISI